MKREIKFRAKNKKTGEWFCWTIEDCLSSSWQDMVAREIEVGWDTLGQWTGLRDKNGTEIYEGDVVEWKTPDELYVSNPTHITERRVVGWDAREAKFSVQRSNFGFLTFEAKVIGNIFENPELCKKQSLKTK